jgi:hypothetical protein
MTSPIFLPWLRRGLAAGIGGPDDAAGGALPMRGSARVAIELADSRGAAALAEHLLRLTGPGDVVGLDTTQVVRMVPPDGASDVEANYLPFVELAAPDLPWLLTPARATGANQLRPWLVLVCVEERDGIELATTSLPLPVLRMGGADAAVELPDLTESWAWTHVQSLVRAPDIDAEVERGTGAVIARLMCPRRLREGRSYLAALVPAFDVGRAAGLGQDVSAFAAAAPAWQLDAMPDVVELPVYLWWRFTTAVQPGDFEDLARRLEPDLDGGRMGFHDALVGDTGALEPFAGAAGFEYEGPLVDPGSRGAALRRNASRWFRNGMTDLLNASAQPAEYDPDGGDPVLAPPFHGSWAADRYTVPRSGWLSELNLDVRRRVAAGLGARVVRDHQHDLLAAAWDQAGDLRALTEELNRGRLAAEVGRSHLRRIRTARPEALLQATSRLHVFVGIAGGTAAEAIRRSVVVPTGMTTPVFVRQTRPGTILAKRAGVERHELAVGTRTVSRFVAASVDAEIRAAQPGDLESLASYGAAYVSAKTFTERTTFEVVPLALEGDVSTRVRAVEPVAPIASDAGDDVTDLAGRIDTQLDPMRSVVAGLARRVSGIDLDLLQPLPTRIPIGPRFPDPLFGWFSSLGSELVLPGVDDFAANRVRLLEVNEGWIAAFLAGANHEWAREALWNEYPADLGATAFSHFWPRIPPETPDLARDMHEWGLLESLAEQVGTAGSSTVLLVRGDLVRRYPDVEFLLVTPDAGGALLDENDNIPAERTTWPAFAGKLDVRTVFVGFDVDPEIIRSEGRYIGIQEPVAGPRFGLDVASPDHHGTAPLTWSDASWGHVAASAEELDAMTHIRFADSPWLDGVVRGSLTWPRNSAHLAGILFQQPFRLLLPATYLMPEREGGV